MDKLLLQVKKNLSGIGMFHKSQIHIGFTKTQNNRMIGMYLEKSLNKDQLYHVHML